jgi:hypothetical protein
MKIISLFSAVTAMLLLTSCAAKVAGTDGNMYQPLSKSQQERLIIISRASLKSNLDKKIISYTEYRDAINTKPSVRIDYRGDRFGTARITWRTRGRQLEFRFEDDLTAEIIPKTSFSTYVIPAHERRIQPDKSIPGR